MLLFKNKCFAYNVKILWLIFNNYAIVFFYLTKKKKFISINILSESLYLQKMLSRVKI